MKTKKGIKKLYLDMETVHIKMNGKYYRFPIQFGLYAVDKNKEEEFETFVKFPENTEVTKWWYFKLKDEYLQTKENKKVTIEEVIKIVNFYLEKNYKIVGWNIKCFDLNILKDFGLKIQERHFDDLLLKLRAFRKLFPKRLKKLLNNKADTVFKFLSKTDLSEKHRALSDCKIEAFIERELNKKYGKDFINCPPEEPSEEMLFWNYLTGESKTVIH